MLHKKARQLFQLHQSASNSLRDEDQFVDPFCLLCNCFISIQ